MPMLMCYLCYINDKLKCVCLSTSAQVMFPRQRMNSPSLSALLKICEVKKKQIIRKRNNGINKHKNHCCRHPVYTNQMSGVYWMCQVYTSSIHLTLCLRSKRPIMVLLQMRFGIFMLQQTVAWFAILPEFRSK